MADFFRDFVSFDPGPGDPFRRAHQPLSFQDFLFSATRAFRLGLQYDGNLVLYGIDDSDLPVDITLGQYRRPIWATNTVGSNAHVWLMQGDGNFVVYDTYGDIIGEAIWYSGTDGNPGAFLRVQDDGNLVVYSADGGVLWSSNTFA